MKSASTRATSREFARAAEGGVANALGNAGEDRVCEEITVNDLTDAAVVNALRRQMTVAAAKQVVASGNLANVNTPGFKAKEFEFSDALTKQLAGGPGLAVTNGKHMSGAGDLSLARTKETEGLPERRDGNTVQIDRELLSMTAAAGEFARAQTALAAKFRLVRYAINEGR